MGVVWFFPSHLSFLSPSIWETARYRLKYCLKGPLSPKQPTNQIHQNALWTFLSVGGGGGWSGGARVLGKFPVPGRPTNLAYSRARAYCAFSRCGWGLFGHFFSLIYHFSFLSPSLRETARYRLKYCLKGPLSPKQPTNQLSIGRKYIS